MSLRNNKTFLSRFRSVWNTLLSKAETPREIQERNDLYKLTLAVTFRDLRNTKSLSSFSNSSISDKIHAAAVGGSGAAADVHYMNYDETNDELGQIFDKAYDDLEQKKVYEMSIRELRSKAQELVRPQLSSLLHVFQYTEGIIPSTTSSSLDSESGEHILMKESNKKKCCDVLYEEQCQTLDLLKNYNMDNHGTDIVGMYDHDGDNNLIKKKSKKKTNQMLFLNKKLSAIQSIASFYQWEHFYFDSHNKIDENDGFDEFGYIQSIDEQVNNSIRYYQMINLSRSALIRQQIGYSIISLKSTLQNAGRGIFVDGCAPAGSILAFFPGDVWPKEYLVNSKALAPYFKKDPRYHLSIRYDDILIDCRKSPYTVLDDVNSNPFAVAHIANHPSKLDEPNCSTMAIDFIDDMKLREMKLEKYVPNTYKKHPMMFGPQAVDKDSIMMHSMGLLSSRDVKNEELFYDYRLSPGSEKSYPDWYHICDEEELKKRWHHDSNDS